MRAVVQRVSEASVTVDGEEIGAIGPGLMILLGVRRGDAPAEAEWLARKVTGLRIFEDEAGKMNRSVLETGGAALIVSQFTLWGDCRKGRRPSFIEAAGPDEAEKLYLDFVDHVGRLGAPTATGKFGAMMKVHLVNDGPVTLIVDTPEPREQ